MSTVRTGRVPPPQPAVGGVPGRRTVAIGGRGAEGYGAAERSRASERHGSSGTQRSSATSSARRRPVQRPHERPGFRPDRAALYAVLLGALLILVAATSSHAAVRARTLRPAPAAALLQSAAPHRSAPRVR